MVLQTFKKPAGQLEGIAPPGTDDQSLGWAIYFWIGTLSTADEFGTAAYKAQELDHLLSNAATQHRETQGNESQTFRELFKAKLRYLPSY